jgi:hypothetical protein
MTYFNTAENQDVCDAVNRAIDGVFDLDDVTVNDVEIMTSLKELLKCARSDRKLLEEPSDEDDLEQIKQGLDNAIEVLHGILENGDDSPFADTDEATLLDVGSHWFAENLETELELRGLRLVKR